MKITLFLTLITLLFAGCSTDTRNHPTVQTMDGPGFISTTNR